MFDKIASPTTSCIVEREKWGRNCNKLLFFSFIQLMFLWEEEKNSFTHETILKISVWQKKNSSQQLMKLLWAVPNRPYITTAAPQVWSGVYFTSKLWNGVIYFLNYPKLFTSPQGSFWRRFATVTWFCYGNSSFVFFFFPICFHIIYKKS